MTVDEPAARLIREHLEQSAATKQRAIDECSEAIEAASALMVASLRNGGRITTDTLDRIHGFMQSNPAQDHGAAARPAIHQRAPAPRPAAAAPTWHSIPRDRNRVRALPCAARRSGARPC